MIYWYPAIPLELNHLETLKYYLTITKKDDNLKFEIVIDIIPFQIITT